jgi:hypothetical protein
MGAYPFQITEARQDNLEMISLENIIEKQRYGKDKTHRTFEYFGLKIECSYERYAHNWKCRLGGIISMNRDSSYVFTVSPMSKKTLAEALRNRLQWAENKTLLFDEIFGAKRV